MPKTLEFAGALGHLAADKRVEILRRVGQGGSISQAARDSGVSYKAAWQALDTLSNLAGQALVERVVGGAGGGGARLTPAGAQLLRVADELATARDQVLARLTAGGGAAPGLAALGLRTSMRNQLPCHVHALERKGPMIQVDLMTAGGDALVSRITRESAQLLGLRPGLQVLALCKATAVEVCATGQPVPGRNLLQGRATRVSRAAGGGEVALTLRGRLALVGFSGAHSGLRVGAAAVAQLDESAVALAALG